MDNEEESKHIRFDGLAFFGDIVSAFISKNSLSPAELPALIQSVHATLLTLAASSAAEEPQQQLVPSIAIKKSVTRDHLISLEDGKPYKTLNRHLKKIGLTPEEYRSKWNLPHDYPMVAASYSEQRSLLAKQLGLGHKKAKRGDTLVEPTKKRRGRPGKAAT